MRHRRRSSAAPGLADHGPGRIAVLDATAGRQPASAPGGDSRVVTLPVGRGTGRHRTPLRRVVKKNMFFRWMILNEDSCTRRRPFRDSAHTHQSIHTPSRDDQCSGFAGETNSDIFRRKIFPELFLQVKKCRSAGRFVNQQSNIMNARFFEVKFAKHRGDCTCN